MEQISRTLESFAKNGALIGPGIAILGFFITGLMIAIPVKSIREFGKENAFYIILGSLLIGGATSIGTAVVNGFNFK